MKYIFTSIIYCFILFTSNSISEQEAHLDLISSGKWYIEFVVMKDQKVVTPTELREGNWMIFHKDGTHEIMSVGKKHKETWKYNKNNNTIVMTSKGEETELSIEKLTKHKLLLSVEIDGKTDKISLIK